MGLIRKTFSISTLGIVNWKSKKEKLAEANAELELYRSDLEQATQKHSLLRDRLTEAEKRAEEAELQAVRDAKSARRKGRKQVADTVGRRQLATATVRDRVTPLVESTRETTHRLAKDLEPSIDDARKRGRKARADAAKRAKKLRKQTKKSAEHAAESVRARADELTRS